MGRVNRMRKRAHVAGASMILLLTIFVLAACDSGGPTRAAHATATSTSTAVSIPPTSNALASVPACQVSQLAMQFFEGSPATGNVTGSLLIRNTSANPCSLQGAVDFYGADAQGQRLAGRMSNPTTLAIVELPPNTPAFTEGASPTAGAYLIMLVLGAYRDDPNGPNALCAPVNEVTPAYLVVTLGSVTLKAANYDPHADPFHEIYGCHGAIFAGAPRLSS